MLDCTHAGSSPHLGILDSCFFVGGSASCGASEQASSGTAIIETQHYSNHGFVSGSVQNNMIQAALSAFGTQQNAVVGHIDKAKLKRKSACTLVGWGCIWTAPATSGDGAAGRHGGATRRRKGCPQGGRQMRGRLVGSRDLLAPKMVVEGVQLILDGSTHLLANCSAEGQIALHCRSDHEPRATRLQAQLPVDWTSIRTALTPQHNCSDVPK